MEEFHILKVTNNCNANHDTGHILKDTPKSVFIALPKKARATECEPHRKTRIMRQVTKIPYKDSYDDTSTENKIYGCETWTMIKLIQKKMESVEM